VLLLLLLLLLILFIILLFIFLLLSCGSDSHEAGAISPLRATKSTYSLNLSQLKMRRNERHRRNSWVHACTRLTLRSGSFEPGGQILLKIVPRRSSADSFNQRR